MLKYKLSLKSIVIYVCVSDCIRVRVRVLPLTIFLSNSVINWLIGIPCCASMCLSV